MRKSIIKFALCGGMLAGMLASCTGDYMDYNTNPYEATKDQMDRDAYLTRSALTGMQGYVIPTDVLLNQFLEALLVDLTVAIWRNPIPVSRTVSPTTTNLRTG